MVFTRQWWCSRASGGVHAPVVVFTCQWWCSRASDGVHMLLMVLICVFCRAVDHLGGKNLVMNLVNHGNPEVRMQALLAIQKMMVQNW